MNKRQQATISEMEAVHEQIVDCLYRADSHGDHQGVEIFHETADAIAEKWIKLAKEIGPENVKLVAKPRRRAPPTTGGTG